MKHTARVLFTACLLVLLCGVCLADMTIWFLDGTSRQVKKIVFGGATAELHLTDGRVMKVPVNTIDLKSSGIPTPVGTYGQTTLTTPGRKTSPTVGAPLVPGGLKQAQLREQWENAELEGIAEKQIGTIRKGQKVKILSQPGGRIMPGTEDTAIQWTDDAYLILYETPDGTLAKKVFDAATFASHFRIPHSKAPATEEPYPEVTRPIPSLPSEGLDTPGDSFGTSDVILPQDSSSEKPQPQDKVAPVLKPRVAKPARKEGRRFPVLLGGLILLALIAGTAALFSRKKSTPVFIDSSRFRQYEEELRDFELEVWLKHGKTPDQLAEICIKKFYQDSPDAMSVALKMLRTSDRNAILPLIARHTGKGTAHAEIIYQEIRQRIDAIRHLIREAQQKKAQSTIPKPAQPFVQPPLPPPPPSPPKIAVAPAEPSTPSYTENRPASTSDVPTYFVNVLSQLSLLTNPS